MLDEKERQARGLYKQARRHTCGAMLSLADELAGKCPKCGAAVLAWPNITPARAAAMLNELRARRSVLGLEP